MKLLKSKIVIPKWYRSITANEWCYTKEAIISIKVDAEYKCLFNHKYFCGTEKSSQNTNQPIGNSKPMKKLQIPDDNTGIRIDPNAGHIQVMSPKQFQTIIQE